MTETTRSAARTATGERGRKPAPRGTARRGGRNPVARMSLFGREASAELRKAVWPTRTELVTYTVVVIVFVSFIIGLVYGLDLGFSKAVFQIFG